jgi:1-acyl-sn-glycerol-3-phosphate acyltransferase
MLAYGLFCLAMIYILKLIRFFWFCWGCLWFFLTGFLCSIFYVFIFNFSSESVKYGLSFKITRFWGHILLFGVFIFPKITRRIATVKNKNYIIVSNHLSMVDIPASTQAINIPFSYLAKIEVDKIPFVGYLARNMHVYVDRNNLKSREMSFQKMKEHLSTKGSLHIFPEGKRNFSNDKLLKFHSGAFKLALEAKTPILIMVIKNTQKCLNSRDKYQLSIGQPEVILSEIIEFEDFKDLSVDELSDLVKDKILTYL